MKERGVSVQNYVNENSIVINWRFLILVFIILVVLGGVIGFFIAVFNDRPVVHRDYVAEAVRAKDYSACDNLPTEERKNRCVIGAASILGDLEICNELNGMIGDYTAKDYCVFSCVLLSLEKNCSIIQDEKLRRQCEVMVK